MSQQQPEQTLGALFADASRDLSKLVHEEVALAKAEIQRSVKNGATGAWLKRLLPKTSGQIPMPRLIMIRIFQ